MLIVEGQKKARFENAVEKKSQGMLRSRMLHSRTARNVAANEGGTKRMLHDRRARERNMAEGCCILYKPARM